MCVRRVRLEIILLIILVYLLCNKHLNKLKKKIINSILNNYNYAIINKIKFLFNKGQNFNDKFIKYMLIFVIVVLLSIKLLHLTVQGKMLKYYTI